MSEIASKPYTEAGSSLAPPFAKKGAATEHDVMFAALFGGVVATQSDAEPTERGACPLPDARAFTVAADAHRGGGGERMNDGGWVLMARLRWRIMGCFLVVATAPNDECGAGVGESAECSCAVPRFDSVDSAV